MRRDGRLSLALHVILHLSDREEGMTSQVLGERMRTHPVVVRRTLAGLRRNGIVRSEKGHGGGWRLGRPLSEVTLGEVYEALGVSTPFNIGYRDRQPRCLLERAANRALSAALSEAETLLLERLHGITLANVLANAPARARSPR